jgi:hypothetical protein
MDWMYMLLCSRCKLSGPPPVSCAAGRDDVADTNFLEWLRDTVYEAVKIAERHESLKLRIREARANIEHRYQLASLQVRHGGPASCWWWSCSGAAFKTGRQQLRNGSAGMATVSRCSKQEPALGSRGWHQQQDVCAHRFVGPALWCWCCVEPCRAAVLMEASLC